MLKSMINPCLSRFFGNLSGKKTKLSLVFILIVLLALSTGLMAQTATPPANGDGSSGNPFQIATLNNLYWITQDYTRWDKHYIQTANIDASTTSGWAGGAGFTPIGNTYVGFFGSYDGQNYTIDGLYINRSGTDFIGLFGRLQESTIQNLGVTNVNITGNIYVGGLVGFCIESSSVINCYSTGTVSGYHSVGGLVGLVNASPVSNSYSTASVNGTNNYIGGLVGINFINAIVSNSYSTGSVSGFVQVGGLVGTNASSNISNSYSTGIVNGDESVGGLVGYNDLSTVSNSFWDTQTSGQSSSAGGTGKTTTEMKTLATFTDVSTVGLDSAWDFVTNPNDDTGNNDYWDMDYSEAINNGYPYLSWQDGDEQSLPVTLSSFTVQYLNNTPTLYWTTQSETDNLGWYVYRNTNNDFSSSQKITDEMIQGNGTTSEPSYYIYNDTSEDIIIGQTYWYWLESIDLGGLTHYYDKAVNITIPDITQDPKYLETPIVYELQSSPNPAKFSTSISFTLNKSAFVEVSIYNILGKLVKTLPMVVTTADVEATVYWDGKDKDGNILENGIYLYQLNVDGNHKETKTLILMR